MDKKFISFALKKRFASIIVFINIVVTVICVYFSFFISYGQRQYVINYQNENVRNFLDSLTFWIITISVFAFLILQLVFTIDWNKGKNNSKRRLFISTLSHFVMETFFIIKYVVDFQFYFFTTTTLVIGIIFLWTIIIDFVLFRIMNQEELLGKK